MMHLHLFFHVCEAFFSLFSFLFTGDCTSDFSTGNDKDTTRQLTASPGYIDKQQFHF